MIFSDIKSQNFCNVNEHCPDFFLEFQKAISCEMLTSISSPHATHLLLPHNRNYPQFVKAKNGES